MLALVILKDLKRVKLRQVYPFKFRFISTNVVHGVSYTVVIIILVIFLINHGLFIVDLHQVLVELGCWNEFVAA